MSKEDYVVANSVINSINDNCERLGLRLTFAYHCNRCDYLWFPKDFDDFGKRVGRDILNLTPPKSCARCKSKNWNSPRQRKIKPQYDTNMPNDGMLTLPRLKAIQRNSKRRKAQVEDIKTQIEQFKKQFDLLKAKSEPIPIRVPNRKKKKKKV